MNNRIIKFRTWDKQNNDMEYRPKAFWENGDINYAFKYGTTHSSDECIFMQYTGLKDKNGKEIYEGDLVKSLPGNVSAIEYDDSHFLLRHSDGTSDFIAKNNFFEVIGNIYENPELLKYDS